MIIENESGKFTVILEDDGTLDTVLSVMQWTPDGRPDVTNSRALRFSTEYAADYRDENGRLTDEGMAALADEAVELYLDLIAGE